MITENGATWLTIVLGLLGGFGTLSGIVLAWRNRRSSVENTAFDQLIKLVNEYQDEIARLRDEVRDLRVKLEDLDRKSKTRELELRQAVEAQKQRRQEEREIYLKAINLAKEDLVKHRQEITRLSTELEDLRSSLVELQDVVHNGSGETGDETRE